MKRNAREATTRDRIVWWLYGHRRALHRSHPVFISTSPSSGFAKARDEKKRCPTRGEEERRNARSKEKEKRKGVPGPTPGDRRREAAVRPRGEKEKVSVPRFLTFLVAKRGEAEAQTKRKGKLPTWRKEEKRKRGLRGDRKGNSSGVPRRGRRRERSAPGQAKRKG